MAKFWFGKVRWKYIFNKWALMCTQAPPPQARGRGPRQLKNSLEPATNFCCKEEEANADIMKINLKTYLWCTFRREFSLPWVDLNRIWRVMVFYCVRTTKRWCCRIFWHAGIERYVGGILKPDHVARKILKCINPPKRCMCTYVNQLGIFPKLILVF